jgi:hypothetical protein
MKPRPGAGRCGMTGSNVVIMPVVRIEQVEPGVRMHVVRTLLTGRALARLRQRASEWDMSIEEVASAILDHALAPPKRRRP